MTPHLPGRPRDAGQRRSRRPGQRPARRPAGLAGLPGGPPAAGIVLTRSPRRPGEILLTPGRTAQPGADCAKRSRPIARREGSRLPGQATPAVSLGQPGILPAHHSRLLLRAAQRTRRPASTS
jgi:hypothetical protein